MLEKWICTITTPLNFTARFDTEIDAREFASITRTAIARAEIFILSPNCEIEEIPIAQ